ncbi:UDP-glucuronosyltransferase 1-6-like isoform X2 [Hyla sarda]|uniref:UDP-glucuronosyltransferase 1-6-like isoform X2 n=1 Tax=Hyla sarda TaxID=327740 RepID=UPI0024C35C3B|nr:UDP-glucuronosyltransferase 1-6-like isoform X2 [Hyla sarda]XP_056389671.1 UDP-glucuronosyltransferase 1-6-like isoform X2 [Hyla sarda]
MDLSKSSFSTTLLIFFAFLNQADGGKLLVVPMDGSHWLSMRPVVERLAQNGHEVVVVMPENSLTMSKSEKYNVEPFPVPYTNQEINAYFQKLSKEHFTLPKHFPWIFFAMIDSMMVVFNVFYKACESLLLNQELIQKLRKEKFDAVLTDPFLLCGVILAEHLDLPNVNFLRGLPCGYHYEGAQCETPLSYVPRLFSKFSDKMTFMERLENFMVRLLEPYYCRVVYFSWVKLATELLKKEVTPIQLLRRSSIWLLRYDFVFEYPKVIMPNMVFIGGINCELQKSLPKDFEKLVNSSGEHGFVVFSLGSMVSEIPMNKAMDVAEALGSIPQTVIWRYTGKAPSNLANNTHLVKWLPQNDLLAHPKARAFITHAGSHGIYEGICNAVPMVMLPLFGDQMDNAKRIESRGAGVTLNVLDMTPEDLSDALDSVINDPRYKENIQRLSALHLDRPIHPLDLAVHWVEFVMRHKGAPHLRPAAHDLNWIQYHSLDVFAFLLAVLVTSLFISYKCCTYTCRRCCGRKSKPKSKSKKE